MANGSVNDILFLIRCIYIKSENKEVAERVSLNSKTTNTDADRIFI